MPPPPSEQALSELLVREEEEWRKLQAQRSRLQEAALQEAHGQLEEAQSRLRRLQEDFIYNLQLLEERDRELERYDAAFARARQLEEAWQAEASELKVEAARLRQALAREAQRLEDLQQQQQRKEQEHRLALQRVRSDKNGELDQQREQYEKLKWGLERKLEELDDQLALQRQELMLEFESEAQRRERAFRLHADSVSGAVLAHELKVKLLNEELGSLREAGAQAAESLQSAQAANAELEDRLQQAAWELRDLAALKDARIKGLEDKLQTVQLTREKEEEVFRRKHEELDRAARERDAVLASVKDAHAEQLRALEARVRELQAQGEALELQARRAEWRQADALKEKDATIAKLREEASTLRSGWDAQVAQLSKEMTSRDLQVQSLQQEAAELQAQLARCQQDVSRYQRQLALAAEREQSLERDKAQLGLDWQRRCAGLERDHYRQSEELIQGLVTAREQVAAKLQEAERKLHEQEVVLKALTLERDQALQALRTHGLLPEQELQVLLRCPGDEAGTGFLSAEIQRLQEQNSSLRDAVARMRAEMEALSAQALPPTPLAGDGDAAGALQPDTQPDTQPDRQPDAQPDAQAAPAAPPDYVLALEAEVRNLKCKFKTLEEQLGDVPEPPKAPSSPGAALASVPPTAGATGGVAPPDSVSVGPALRRLGDRTRLLNLLVARLRQKVPQEAGEVDAVQCALPHEVDQVHLEVLELQRQVAELEQHLGTAGRGGRRPPSRQQLLGPHSVALGRQVLATGGPVGSQDPGVPPPPAPSVQQLQRKLKEAARTALRLRLEKEQLLELGNRLRAELGRPAGKPRHPRPSAEARSPGEGPETPSEHGPPLRQLQPHLPSQGLRNTYEGRPGETPPPSAPTVCRNDAPRGTAAGTAGPGQKQHRVSTGMCKSARQKENRPPEPGQAPKCCQGGGPCTQMSSSPASSSLQDTWKLLELGSSPSGLASQGDSTPAELTAPAAADSPQHADGSPTETRTAFTVKGVKMEAQAKAKPARPPRAHPANPKRCQRAPKIRNYNFKD